MRYRITTPVPDYCGSVGAVTFDRGVAVADESAAAELAYFRSRGYGVEELADEPAEPELADEAGPEMPKKSASTEAWRDYAAATGEMTEDEAGQMSRDDLVEYFNSTSEENPS